MNNLEDDDGAASNKFPVLDLVDTTRHQNWRWWWRREEDHRVNPSIFNSQRTASCQAPYTSSDTPTAAEVAATASVEDVAVAVEAVAVVATTSTAPVVERQLSGDALDEHRRSLRVAATVAVVV
ncbi:hypothetical protein GCK72_008235 [Caenorhabditis remanei]|uniref:Uncharacterized protein n=1 Tax=Caenorhabditis remanei TaxID=31234 RepID=A0A6A5GWY7_CAERE|nr:hypothetical protein GCK72_008235 [Caenorhabditis remanei]KAF1759990.1 hypothetical protein GCK72_008235 [Caenorhabditis remanei]